MTAEEGLGKLRAYRTDQAQLMGKVTGEEEGAKELFDSHFNALAIANELIERIGEGKRLA